MSYINVTNVTFESAVSPIDEPFRLTIRLDCLKKLSEGKTFRPILDFGIFVFFFQKSQT